MHFQALQRLKREVRNFDPTAFDEQPFLEQYPEARRGAVLVLFYPRDGEPHIALTLRTPNLTLHSGQISLPGGRIDPLDFSAAEAALRETREEIGINTDHLMIRGPLVPVFTHTSNYLLIPFLGFAEEAPSFVPNPAEVAEMIELPWRILIQPGSVEEEIWQLREGLGRVSFYRFGEHRIWGATARVLRQVVEAAGGPPPPPEYMLPGEVEPLVTIPFDEA